MAGLRTNNLNDPDFVPPSKNEPGYLTGQRSSVVRDTYEAPAAEPGEFEKGLSRGTAMLKAGAYGAAEAAGVATGIEAVEEFGEAGVARAHEEASAVPAAEVESVFDINDVSSFFDWAAHGLGVLAPSAVTMAGSGGAGALAGAVTRIGAARTAAAGAFAASAAPETGHAFTELKEGGVESPGAAALQGGIIGLLDVAPQAHLLKMLGTKGKPGVLRGAARGVLDQAPREAATEAAQEAVGEGFRTALIEGHDNPNFVNDLIEAGALGALGGGFAGGVGGAAKGAAGRVFDEDGTVIQGPGAAASRDITAFDDAENLAGTSAADADLAQYGLTEFDTNPAFTDVPVDTAVKTKLSGEARERLGLVPEDIGRTHIPTRLERLNAPFVAGKREEQEQFQTELGAGTLLGEMNSARAELQSIIDNEGGKLFTFAEDGKMDTTEAPGISTRVADALASGKPGEQVSTRTLMERLDEALGRAPEAIAEAQTEQAVEGALGGIEGPFQSETLHAKVTREAERRFPNDTELQQQFINQEGEALFTQRSGQAENEELAGLLGIPTESLTPADTKRMKQLRTVLDRAQRVGFENLYDFQKPGDFLKSFEGIRTPALNDIREMLATGDLDPETRTDFENILATNRPEGVDFTLKGVSLTGPKPIQFSAQTSYDTTATQFRVPGSNKVINLTNLTNEARRQRQRQEEVFKASEKPLEERGAMTDEARLANDVMIGLDMASEEGLITLPSAADANGRQALIAWGATKRMREEAHSPFIESKSRKEPRKKSPEAKARTAERLAAQEAAAALAKTIGLDTVVETRDNRTFRDVLKSLGIKTPFAKRRVPSEALPKEGEKGEPGAETLTAAEAEAASAKAERFDPKKDKLAKTRLKEQRATAKLSRAMLEASEKEVAGLPEGAAKKQAQKHETRLKKEVARAEQQLEQTRREVNRVGVKIDMDVDTAPKTVLLTESQMKALDAVATKHNIEEFELQGTAGSSSLVTPGQTKILSHTQEIPESLIDNTGLSVGQIDAMFNDVDTLIAVRVTPVKERQAKPTPVAQEPVVKKEITKRKVDPAKRRAAEKAAVELQQKQAQAAAKFRAEEALQKARDVRRNMPMAKNEYIAEQVEIADKTVAMLESSGKERAQLKEELDTLKEEHAAKGRKAAESWLKDKKYAKSVSITPVDAKKLSTANNTHASEIFKQLTSKINAPQSIKLLKSSRAIKELNKDGKSSWVGQLADGSMHGFTVNLADGSIGVYVRPGMDKALTREVMGHEVGHAVFRSFTSTLDSRTANAILREYTAWRDKHNKSTTTIKELLKAKKQPKSVLLAMHGAQNNTKVHELESSVQEYLLDYEEWFADNVSRWFTDTRAPQTAMQRFFKAIADTLKRMVGIGKGEGINDLMDSIAGGRRKWDFGFEPQDAFAASSAVPVQKPTAALLRTLTGNQNWLEDTAKLKDLGYVAMIDSQDPYSVLMHRAMYKMLYSDQLTGAATNLLLRTARSKGIQNVMRTLLQNDRTALDQLSDPYMAAAYLYQFWRADMIALGQRTDSLFQRIAKFFRDFLGIIADSENAQNVFRMMHANTFPMTDVAQRSAVQRVLPDSIAENAVKTLGPTYDVVMKPMRSLFQTVDERVRAFDNPALTQIADHFHLKPGEQSSNPTMWNAKQEFIGRYENIMRRIFDGKDKAFGDEALNYLYGVEDISHARPGVQRVVKQVRALLREMLKYQQDAGVSIKDIGTDYFPWVLNQDAISDNLDAFREMLLQDKYKENRKELAIHVNVRDNARAIDAEFHVSKHQLEKAVRQWMETGEWDLVGRVDEATIPVPQPHDLYTSESIVDHLVGRATAEGGLEFEISDDRQSPSIRFNNPRIFKFVEPKEMRKFLSDDLGMTMGMYISQGVKHAEFSRRFGEDGGGLSNLLRQARETGATPKQVDLATNYVRASLGTYGRQTAEWLNKRIGLALPEHAYSPINAGLNKAMGVAIVYQNLRYLALSTLTSLADVMGIAVRSSSLKATVGSMKAFTKRNQNNLKDLGEMLGLIEHSQVADALGWRYDGMHLTGKLRGFNDAFFRVIGLQAWTRSTRLMGLAAAEAFIVKHTQRPSKHSQRWMNELNITKADIKLRDDGTLRVMSHVERGKASKAEVARDDRVRNALIQWTDEAILRPNPSMRTLWGSDPHFQLFQYLKSFMYTFHERILKRAGHEMMEGNYASFVWLLGYIPVMIMSDLIREAIQFGTDGDPRKSNWGAGDYIQHGAIRSGLLGYTQQGVDFHTDMKYGGFGIGGMTATFDTIASMPDLLTGKDGSLVKALPGQTVYKNWLN